MPCRKRGFDSRWVLSPVEQRSARRSDKAEIVGSNPTGRTAMSLSLKRKRSSSLTLQAQTGDRRLRRALVEQRSARHVDIVETDGSNPSGSSDGLVVQRQRCLAHIQETGVRFPPRPLVKNGDWLRPFLSRTSPGPMTGRCLSPFFTTSSGLLVQQEDAALARRRSGCDSLAVHCCPGGERDITSRS